MSEDEKKLAMWFPYRNVCLRECQQKLCVWGQRKVTKDSQGNIRGNLININ